MNRAARERLKRRAVVYPGRAAAWMGALSLFLGTGPLWAAQPGAAAAAAAAAARATTGLGSASRPAARPPTAQAQAPFDPSGYWVSLITENWRWRMVVPGKGEYADVPINLRAKQLADAWNPATDEAAGKQCEAYGAAVIMRNPERLHISWQDANTLRVDTDEGMQTRLLRFVPPAAPGGPAAAPEPLAAPHTDEPPSWQGQSAARWQLAAGTAAAAAPAAAPRFGSLEVSTDDMLPGLLRKNGIPYGADTQMREFWDLRTLGTQRWISISVRVTDPQYLRGPYIYDSIFQQEPDGSKWAASVCTLRS